MLAVIDLCFGDKSVRGVAACDRISKGFQLRARRRRRLPDHQLGRKRQRGTHVLAADLGNQQAGRLATLFGNRLPDGGQRWCHPFGHRNVVVADYRQVLGHTHSVLARACHQSDRCHVTHREDGSRMVAPAPQLPESSLARRKSDACGHHTRRRAAGGTDRLPVARQPAGADPTLAAVPRLAETDDRNAPMTEFEQMLGGESRTAEVIDVDSGHAWLGICVDQDAGQTNAPEGVKTTIPSQAQADKAVYGGTADGTLEGAIQGWNQQKRQVVLLADLADAADQERRERIRKDHLNRLWNEESDGSASFGGKRSSGWMRGIAELASDRHDALARGLADLIGVIESKRNGRLGDPRRR